MSTYFDMRASTWDEDVVKQQRTAAVAEAVKEVLPADGNLAAFELGCGTGSLALLLRDKFSAMTLSDTSEGMLDVLRAKLKESGTNSVEVVSGELNRDNVKSSKYDVAFTQMTLHHINDIPAILDEFKRILKPGGLLCLADLDKEDGSFHGAGFDGHNGFDRDNLKQLALNAGFGNVSFKTIYEMKRKSENGSIVGYPVFFMSAEAGR